MGKEGRTGDAITLLMWTKSDDGTNLFTLPEVLVLFCSSLPFPSLYACLPACLKTLLLCLSCHIASAIRKERIVHADPSPVPDGQRVPITEPSSLLVYNFKSVACALVQSYRIRNERQAMARRASARSIYNGKAKQKAVTVKHAIVSTHTTQHAHHLVRGPRF